MWFENRTHSLSNSYKGIVTLWVLHFSHFHLVPSLICALYNITLSLTYKVHTSSRHDYLHNLISVQSTVHISHCILLYMAHGSVRIRHMVVGPYRVSRYGLG